LRPNNCERTGSFWRLVAQRKGRSLALEVFV
jgi:hypothetical protein